jgi:hypothetical protein
MEKQMTVVNINLYKLVSNFSTFSSNHWGSCIIVQKDEQTKE